MPDTSALIAALLQATDHPSRNALAIKLAESGVPEVLPVLLALIERPDLQHHRGTLVHCLGYFDCRPHFSKLVDLVIAGNWETAHEAFGVLQAIDTLGTDQVLAGFNALEAALQHTPEDWHAGLITDLLAMFA
ncbi:hypothetical protein IGB42_03004 [Andreprevotia sp. IGB-42]|uniref:hypothetical protein n=1 Tax=Andreprevotia sp. IGB-42 TaxID=2497473 RepID=UPI0013595261|nr:hypothetical protein [Andreprevotia sp. IGB-42]KAF0812712.1 hypothetical protein IGB42_03004 [Andreprevotia sp. IGB-42]